MCNIDPAPISSGFFLKFTGTIRTCVCVIGPGDGVVGSPEKLGAPAEHLGQQNSQHLWTRLSAARFTITIASGT